jgi:hypothetical protein
MKSQRCKWLLLIHNRFVWRRLRITPKTKSELLHSRWRRLRIEPKTKYELLHSRWRRLRITPKTKSELLHNRWRRLRITPQTNSELLPSRSVGSTYPTLEIRLRTLSGTGTWQVAPARPVRSREVEDHTFSKQSVHRQRWGCQPYGPAVLFPPDESWYPILLEDESISGP